MAGYAFPEKLATLDRSQSFRDALFRQSIIASVLEFMHVVYVSTLSMLTGFAVKRSGFDSASSAILDHIHAQMRQERA